MATLTWDEVGGDPVPGDPGAISQLARTFSETSDNARDAQSRLKSFSQSVDDKVWRGEGAQAFRGKISDLPPRLAKLQASYATAAEAMSGYAVALGGLQSEAQGVMAKSHDASDAEKRLEDIADRRATAEKVAINKLQDAQEQGIPNDSAVKRIWDDISSWVGEHATFLRTLADELSKVASVLAFIPGLQDVALVLGALSALTNLALAATGNGDWKTALISIAASAGGVAGKFLETGAALEEGAAGYEEAAAAPAAAREEGSITECGDPVDIATGDVIRTDTDVALAGALPLVLARTHRSSCRAGRLFGPSWSSTLDQRVQVGASRVFFGAADGMLLIYPRAEVGVEALADTGPRWPLVGDADGGYSITDPDRGRTLHFSAVAGSDTLALAAVSDRNGHRIDVVRASDGTPLEVRHSGGYRIGVETLGGRVRSLCLIGAEGGADVTLVGFGYDDSGRLTEVVNSSGVPLRFDYDSAGRMTRWQDRNGYWYRYTYDDEGRCVRTEGSDGYMNGTFSYDRNERVTVFTNSLGHDTTFRLNELYQVIGEIDPLGHATVSDWDRYHRLRARTDPLGRTVRFDYDAGGNLTALTRPDGATITAEYHQPRLPATVTATDGAVWHREYDERGNLTAVTDPVGARTTYAYDQSGHLVTVTDALGRVHHLETNAAGLPAAMTDPSGATVLYARDAFGRVTAITDPVGGITRLGWTIEGKLATRLLPDGATERWAYDDEGNRVEYLDAVSGVTRTEFTTFDLPAAETDPVGARLELGYDTELRLVTIRNSAGSVWRYHYDPAGNLTRETDFDGRVLQYAYDDAGQLVERTNGAGETTRFDRDVLGNVVERRCGDTVSTFGRDSAGRMTRAVNADADVAFERDRLGRVVSESCNGRAVTSSYDLLGRRTYRRTPSGAESAWEYDPTGRSAALRSAGHTLKFEYDEAGREVELRFGDALLAQTWDVNHRLTSQTLTTTRSSRPIQQRSYMYRPDGYLTRFDDYLSGGKAFDLDAVGRITGVHGSAWTERYAYDSAGNVVQGEWPTPPSNPLGADTQGEREYAGTVIRRAGNVRFEHDAQGRVVLRQQKRLSAKPLNWRYSWDAEDRLVAVSTPDGERWRYRYDALGRRVAKQRLTPDGDAVAEQVDFHWDSFLLAEQVEARSDRATTWHWKPGTFRAVGQTERGRLDEASQEWVDQQFYAIVADLVGTPTELVDSDGNVVWHPTRTLWGTVAGPAAGDSTCPLRFPGHYFDSETGLHYNYHRVYDPSIGQFLSSDPLGLYGSLNPHGYVPNPTRWIDPLGLQCARAPSSGPDFVAGPIGSEPPIPVSQSRMAAGFDQAGFPSTPTDSPGVEYTLPDGTKVRLMEPSGQAPRRASFTNANGGPINPFTGKPVQPPPPAGWSMRDWVRALTHVEQGP